MKKLISSFILNHENEVYNPNEIFDELSNSGIKHQHVPFAYAYYTLQSYLYNTTAYNEILPTQKDIKEWLGFNPCYAKLNYIIKKNGELDSIGYTKTTNDYPIGKLKNDDNGVFMYERVYEQEYELMVHVLSRHSPNYHVKYPVKCFWRNKEDVDSNDYYKTGTFYDISNTHKVDMQLMNFMMERDELGVDAFYLYQYLLFKSDKHTPGYKVTYSKLSNDLKFSIPKITKILKALCKYNCLSVSCENDSYFKHYVYKTNDFSEFGRKFEIKMISKELKNAKLDVEPTHYYELFS